MGGETAEEKKPGFVATISGYSPYEKIGELMTSYGVEGEQDKWGFVTGLFHLDDFVVEGDSPFEVYKNTDPNQFNLEIKEVNLEKQIPAGIGIMDVRYKPTPAGSRQEESAEWVLIDPMTRETISRIAEWEEDGRAKLYGGQQVYTVNDHWFVLKVKFVWRDAPESVKVKAPELPAFMLQRAGMISPTPPQSPDSTGKKELIE